MFRTSLLVQKEIAANIRSYKLPAASAIMVSLFVLSTHLLMIDFMQRRDDWAKNQAAQNSPQVGGLVRYSLPDGSFSHNVGEASEPPMQPPQPLSVLVKGMDTEMERSVAVGQRIGFGSRLDENPISTLYNTPDTAFIVQTLVSLFALFFSVDTVTREKEAGSLKALFANPIRGREVLLGKAIGASISLFVSFAAGFFSGVLYLYSAQGVLSDKEDMVRTLLIFGLNLIYGLLFVFLGLFISTISVRTKNAIVTALLAWGATVLVLPNAAVLAAKVFFPAPSYNRLNARLYEAQQKIVEDHLRAHPEARAIFDIQDARQVAFRIIEMDQQLTDDYIYSKLLQIEQARRLAYFSPAGAQMFGSSELAGTGAGAYRSYMEFLRSGRDMVVEALKRQWDLPPREGAVLVNETLNNASSRQYKREPLSASLRSAMPAFALLLAWTILLGLAAFRRFQRYDVR